MPDKSKGRRLGDTLPARLSIADIDPTNPPSPAALRAQCGIRFHHFSNGIGEMCATIATRPALEKDAHGRDQIEVACTFVHRKERPNRAEGRRRALLRLLGGFKPNRAKLKFRVMPVDEFKAAVRDRSILAEFPGFAFTSANEFGVMLSVHESALRYASLETEYEPAIETPVPEPVENPVE
jgi:hypothetical protein